VKMCDGFCFYSSNYALTFARSTSQLFLLRVVLNEVAF
jgi:hypothetical protein